MRCSVWIVSLSLLLSRFPTQSSTFPIPADMHETWPGAKLTGAEKLLLQKAVDADLRKLRGETQSVEKSMSEKFDSADVALGTLGNGVIVSISDPVLCGTGGCLIYAYLREKGGFRNILAGDHGMGSLGWAFAVVKSKTGIPDLVIASNAGGGLITLTLYRYSGSAFSTHTCEFLSAKNPNSTLSSWWDPSQVFIEPCGQH